MKVRYVGSLRRDGGYPKVSIDGDEFSLSDGVIEVQKEVADQLVATGNFVVTRFKTEEVQEDLEPIDQDDESELIAKAKSLGIKATRNWGVPKLKAAIAEKEAA